MLLHSCITCGLFFIRPEQIPFLLSGTVLYVYEYFIVCLIRVAWYILVYNNVACRYFSNYSFCYFDTVVGYRLCRLTVL